MSAEKYVWLRWYHGAVSDDKWPLIARRTGQPIAVIVAVWVALLECASQAEERGSVADFDAESMDALLQVDDGACQAIYDALSGGKRPRIAADKIVNWERRQPVDEGATERKRLQREREKLEAERVALEQLRQKKSKNIQENQSASQAVTQCHTVSQAVTAFPEMSLRGEEIREEKEERGNTASAPPLASPAAERILALLPDGREAATPAQSPKQALTEPVAMPAALDVPPSRPRGKKQHHVPPEGEPCYRAKSGRYLTGKRLASFERFWAAFDLRMGKTDAADAWLDIPALTDALVDEICRAAGLEAQQRVADTARGKSPKWPQGWLNSRRWEDYELQKPSAQAATQATPLPRNPTPEELEENRQRGLRYAQQMRELGTLPGGSPKNGLHKCNFGAAIASAVGAQ